MAQPLRALMVEDSEDDALLLVDVLRAGGFETSYIRVDIADAMRQALATAEWDIVLADFSLPHFSGPAALETLKESGLDIPLIIVSGTVTEQQAIDMMREGAKDFILKQNLKRLAPAVERELHDAQARHERRQAREALRDSELRYRTLFTVEPDALILFNLETLLIADANDAAQQLFGYTLDEFRTLTMLDLSAEPEATFASIQTANVYETTRAQRLYRKKSGETFSVEIAARKFTLDTQTLIFAALRDITERIQAQEALERERAFLSSAIELLPFPVIFNTPEGVLIRANQASYQFFGDLKFTDWWERQLFTPARVPIPRDQWPMVRAAHGEVVPSTEGILVLPDGREIPALVVAAPIYLGEQLVATVVSFTDITELKSVDKAKNQFLAVLSHELRTPLTNILGWVKAAQDMPEMTIDALRIIQHNAEIQQRMLENLLEVTRIFHGKLDLRYESVDLWHLMVQAAQAKQPEVEERTVQLELISPASPLQVKGDPKYLRIALENLLDNAVRFTDSGGQVTVHGWAEEAMAHVSIEDTGHGIAPDLFPRVFELFQTSQEVKQTVGGLGLGLPLAKAIIERHGGWITGVSPGVGQGSTFTIALPLDG